jgi:hypothetical protein
MIGRTEAMTEISIERLTLKLSGISERDGQRLAQLIAEGLGDHISLSSEAPRHLDSMRVNVAARPGSSLDMLAKQVVADMLRQLERSL